MNLFAGKVLEHCIQKLEHYIYLLQCNITKYNQNLLKATSSATLETMTDRSYIVGELSAYLLNHKIDPHSCFVGLAPSKTQLILGDFEICQATEKSFDTGSNLASYASHGGCIPLG